MSSALPKRGGSEGSARHVAMRIVSLTKLERLHVSRSWLGPVERLVIIAM